VRHGVSNEIDIYLAFEPDADNPDNGAMIVHIDDYGDGERRQTGRRWRSRPGVAVSHPYNAS
jgi:hypothetical protein